MLNRRNPPTRPARARHCLWPGRRRRRPPTEDGSGTAIGVAILFPMLMLVIVTLRMLSDTARIEQGIQASANRAARAAALCCHYTDGAEEVAKASLRAAETAGAYNRIYCNNDVEDDSRVVFLDVDGAHVPNTRNSSGNPRPVPAGGTVHVFVTCRIPPQVLGGFGIAGLDAERTVRGVATIDPFRLRAGT